MSLNIAHDPASGRRLTRRALILGGAQLAFAGVLTARLRYLQVDQAEEYRLLAEENRIAIRLIPPARGLILDRKGRPLAENRQNWRITVVREEAGDVTRVLDRLARLIPLDPEEHARALAQLKRLPAFVPVTVAERLSWEQVARLSVNAPVLPGVSTEVGLTRYYPRRGDFAHVVGYVGPVSDYDLKHMENPDPVLQIPGFQIGKTGIEKKLEPRLRGQAGTRRIEVNAAGRMMREIDRKPSRPGADLVLTVDARLQAYVQARLAGQSASAVVMDVHTGDIVALGSAPSFDPNKFVRGIGRDDYRALLDDKFRPLANKSVQGTYPPGSTFKMVVALAALEDGLLDPDEIVTCRGYIELGKQRFHCWKRGGHGRVDLLKSLEQSCDVYYYELAQRVGIERIAAMARRFGLGSRHKLPLNGIAAGLIPDKAWKARVVGEEWRVGDSLNAGIGQGYVLTSPIQLATMTARLASGRAVVPRLLKAIDGTPQEPPPAPSMGLAAHNLAVVRKGMFLVSNSRRGTAWSTRIAEQSLALAGKTGTSQVRRITRAERAAGIIRNEDLPWERRDHALFVAYAPYEKPRYAVAVVVEHGGGGSRFAAPIARDVLLEALFEGPPPLSAYPASQRTRIRAERARLRITPWEEGEDGA